MNGFKAFKYYTALKLHFTDPTFNVFVNRGRVKGSYDKFLMRNDRMLFEKVAKMFTSDKEYIQFLASNFMYGHHDMIYEQDDANRNYKEFLRRKQSITKVFKDDLATVVENKSRNLIMDVVQLYMAKKITIESLVILDHFEDISGKLKANSHLQLMFGADFLKIEKSSGFVKFDQQKVEPVYLNFLEELRN